MASLYWERHPDGPFVTLIAVAATYLEPENYDPDCLKALAKREDDEEMRVSKSELREALRDPGQLPGDELFESVEYDNGSGEAFLAWLWHELNGDEPFDAGIITRLKTLPEPFAGRLYWQVRVNVGKAVRAGEWGEALVRRPVKPFLPGSGFVPEWPIWTPCAIVAPDRPRAQSQRSASRTPRMPAALRNFVQAMVCTRSRHSAIMAALPESTVPLVPGSGRPDSFRAGLCGLPRW